MVWVGLGLVGRRSSELGEYGSGGSGTPVEWAARMEKRKTGHARRRTSEKKR